jgi:hypothetical protein
MTTDTHTASRDLDRAIAERLGWTEIEPVSYWEETYYDTYEVHTLRGKQPGASSNDTLLPAFATDLNAAIDLLKQIPLGAVGINEDGETWFCNGYIDGAGVVVDVDAPTPALAICRAILAYTSEQGS